MDDQSVCELKNNQYIIVELWREWILKDLLQEYNVCSVCKDDCVFKQWQGNNTLLSSKRGLKNAVRRLKFVFNLVKLHWCKVYFLLLGICTFVWVQHLGTSDQINCAGFVCAECLLHGSTVWLNCCEC